MREEHSMCTAISLTSGGHYFGRNLDLEVDPGGSVVITPRAFPLAFRRMPALTSHLAMIGMARVENGYPLYFDAANETGLCAAGLNFPGYAHYAPPAEHADNITPFELIMWILAQCSCVAHARTLLARVNLCAIPFSEALPLTPLHFLFADGKECITVEPVSDGLKVYDNPAGVLTNSPPFDWQMTHLCRYMTLDSRAPENTLCPDIPLKPYSRGMGALGLPGDLSSSSRFVRAAFLRAHSRCSDIESEGISQLFHLLSGVHHIRGSVMVGDQPEITLYSSCFSAASASYCYTTYENSQITAVSMHQNNLDAHHLTVYSLNRTQQIYWQKG